MHSTTRRSRQIPEDYEAALIPHDWTLNGQ